MTDIEKRLAALEHEIEKLKQGEQLYGPKPKRNKALTLQETLDAFARMKIGPRDGFGEYGEPLAQPSTSGLSQPEGFVLPPPGEMTTTGGPGFTVSQKPFAREDRYFVFKRSHVAMVLNADEIRNLNHIAQVMTEYQKYRRKPANQYVVIESDWPEYEPAWQAIERRCTGVHKEDSAGFTPCVAPYCDAKFQDRDELKKQIVSLQKTVTELSWDGALNEANAKIKLLEQEIARLNKQNPEF